MTFSHHVCYEKHTGLSTDAVRDALLLNGITDKAGSLIMRLAEARGPRTFDRHEHDPISPSHLLYCSIGSHLLIEAHETLSVEQRDKVMREMRLSVKHAPTHTIQ